MELNAEQRRAAEAVRGPVCILAGAGSGKTTTITRRIAHQVATEAFRADEILAVTFTDKAAGELRSRVEALGAPGVTRSHLPRGGARAAAPLRARARRQILASKALPLRRIANSLPGAVPLPPGRRPRDRDRVGEEPAHHARPLPRGARRPRAADPAGPHAPRLPAVRAAQDAAGLHRLRGPARAGDPHVLETTTSLSGSCASASARSPSTSTRT